MFPQSVQTDPKMEPKAVPERSPSHFQRKAVKNSKNRQKSIKSFKKVTKGLPEIIQKELSNHKKRSGLLFFPHQKNDDNSEAVFSCFCLPPGGPRASKSSQNAIMVCKNEGPTFSRKATLFYKN